jgi:multidrug efflux pump subunit AcrB
MSAITSFFVERWQVTLVAFTLLVALGVNAVIGIPKSEDPIARFPITLVSVVLPGADASEMEQLVAIPIEEAINRIEDVAEIESNISAGFVSVRAEFVWGVDPDRKFDEVVREVNRIRPDLPTGVRDVRLDRASTANANVVQMALVSQNASMRQMRAYAEARGVTRTEGMVESVEREGETGDIAALPTRL